MKELKEIIHIFESRPGETFCLATVVKVEGSSYRRPGARMLIDQTGRTTGSISGGCLEQDVVCRAKAVFDTGEATRLTYDTTSDEDALLGSGLGCHGVIDILVERVTSFGPDADPSSNIPAFLSGLFNERRRGVISTVIHPGGVPGIAAGERLMWNEPAVEVYGEIRHEGLKSRMITSIQDAWDGNRFDHVRHETEDGTVEVFNEIIRPPNSLVIFGAGYDAIPLTRLASEMGFKVMVVDARPAYATRERFPHADAVVLAAPETIGDELRLDDRTSAVVMTHNYPVDLGWLQYLLPQGLPYIGLMGPRKRAEKMLQELSLAGIHPTDIQLNSVHNPVGLDIGAESPEQIALSILAEIQAATAGQRGGRLREKKGPLAVPPSLQYQDVI